MAVPIWKDYYVDFGQVSVVDYEIRLTDGSVIFAGRSYPRPGESSLKVKINDICADYMEQIRIRTSDGFESNDIAKEFRIFNSYGTLIDTVTFVNDWSYDYDRTDNGVLSDPITGLFDLRMPVMYSVSRAQTIVVKTLQDQKLIQATGPGTLTLTSNVEGRLMVGGTEYQGVTSCYTHSLYYVNAYGGWDFLLLQGRSIETDSYARHEHNREYDNSNVSSRGSVNHLNEVRKSYVLHTGWLVGDQPKKMHHLIGSTQVYLFEIGSQRMIPVTITDTACKYKSYQSEGGKLVEYEINVKVAKEMIRR